MSLSRAHPRSRGENCFQLGALSAFLGSSPLTRGKPAIRPRRGRRRRLIPAHAGKTRSTVSMCQPREAHPRSRGENARDSIVSDVGDGSSPLTRGKLDAEGPPALRGRLIPAHAGKTERPQGSRLLRWAHPRSRGENGVALSCLTAFPGSSPLTRGKRVRDRLTAIVIRLIPAHAGKTL